MRLEYNGGYLRTTQKIAFGEYKDGLCKDGIISQSLYQRATLY